MIILDFHFHCFLQNHGLYCEYGDKVGNRDNQICSVLMNSNRVSVSSNERSVSQFRKQGFWIKTVDYHPFIYYHLLVVLRYLFWNFDNRLMSNYLLIIFNSHIYTVITLYLLFKCLLIVIDKTNTELHLFNLIIL